MRRPLTHTLPPLLAVLVIAAALGATAGVATAQRGDEATPPPRKPLAAARARLAHGAGAGRHRRRRRGHQPAAPRVRAGQGALAAGCRASSASPATARSSLSLASSAGRVELTGDGDHVTLYDERSDTEYRLPVGARPR